MKKLISFIFLFAIMFYSTIANAGPNLVADEYGCYYWNGDRNYLAITTSGFSHVMAKLDTARFEKYNGINTVNVMLCLTTPDGENVIVRTHGNFFGDGSFKYLAGSYSHITIGNVPNVVATLAEAAR